MNGLQLVLGYVFAGTLVFLFFMGLLWLLATVGGDRRSLLIATFSGDNSFATWLKHGPRILQTRDCTMPLTATRPEPERARSAGIVEHRGTKTLH